MGKFIDLTGQKFGRLTVIERDTEKKPQKGHPRTFWRCECECGNEVVVDATNLRNGNQVSCGCYRNDNMRKMARTHGDADSRLYNVWQTMKNRCYNPNVDRYSSYGGRGIRVCDEWINDYTSFRKWALDNGYDESLPRGVQTIDRIDVNGNYEPDNCRLVDMKTQANNRRNSRRFEYDGKLMTARELSEVCGVDCGTIYQRITKYGRPVRLAVETI